MRTARVEPSVRMVASLMRSPRLRSRVARSLVPCVTWTSSERVEHVMARQRNVDCGDLYEALRREMITLYESFDARQLGTLVLATPEWSVRDVLCHVVGITADLNAQNFGT